MHQLMWRTAAPLWEAESVTPPALRAPAILRFAGDDFMEQIQQQLDDAEAPFDELIARRETWRSASSAADRVGVIDPEDEEEMAHLKLYQPAQDRFYLVGANLVCRRAGLPDHRIGGQERVSMLVRRLAPVAGGNAVDPADPATYEEHAWDGARWRALNGDLVRLDEQRLPLVATVHERDERKRRLLTGLIPVAAREAYEATVPRPSPSPDADIPPSDARSARLIETVIRPLAELHQGAAASPRDDALIAEAFVFTALDLADYLRRIADLGDVLDGEDTTSALAVFLANAEVASQEWRSALAEVEAARTDVLLGAIPSTLHVANLDAGRVRNAIAALAGSLGPTASPDSWELYSEVVAQLPDRDESPQPAPPEPAAESGALYVVRCLYEKENCPIRPEWLSDPSEPFRMAGFFDPDAPARDIRIAMPFDTSPAGLRKFPRNVSVMLSSQLRKQMARVENIKIDALEEGDLGPDDGFDLGMVCSLSIPIITIAALILLMIIVSILNIVFWWLPLFKVCVPVSGGGE